MKKATIGILFCLFVTSLFLFTACNKGQIGTPTGIAVDEDNNMTWTEVADTKNYTVEVVDYETREVVLTRSVRKPIYSLSELSEGDYDIRIKAIPSSRMMKESEWSETIFFHKLYETGCVYTLINNEREYQISKVGRASGEFTIEDVYRGKPVTSIADGAFRKSKTITAVTIGNNVTYVGASAFSSCPNLQKVTMSETVTEIGNNCFMLCVSLKEVNVPKGVTVINQYLFANCSSLESITLHDNVKAIGESAFSGCGSLKEIVIPDSVVTIGQKAFENCKGLDSLTVGKGVNVIYSDAFKNCSLANGITFAQNGNLQYLDARVFSYCTNLKGVDLPEGLLYIGTNCFVGCSEFEHITIPDSVTQVGTSIIYKTKLCTAEEAANEEKLFYADKWLVGVSFPLKTTVVSIGDDSVLAEDGTPAKKIDIKEGTVGICSSLFYRADLLQSVRLPSTVKYVGSGAFQSCPKLFKFDAYNDDALEVVGSGAFYECTNLSTVRMGQNLKEIGSYCFYKCEGLGAPDESNYHLLIPDSVRKIGGYAFFKSKLWNNTAGSVVYAGKWAVGVNMEKVSATFDVTLKEDTVGIADYALAATDEEKMLTNVSGMDNVKYIGEGAFYMCGGLQSVTITDYIEEISDFMFYGCVSLSDIGNPLNLIRIGRSAFYGCRALTSLDLSSLYKLETIDRSAFAYCDKLTEVLLPSYALTEVSDYAFYNCVALKNMTIPDTITTIGKEAFAGCAALETLEFEQNTSNSGELTEIGESAFYQCYMLKEVKLPATVKMVGKAAFYGCVSVLNLELSDSLEYIGENAFCGLNQITDLELGNNLNYIGNYAFSGCESLKSVTLSKEIDWIGAWAFYQCNLATIYTDAEEAMPDWSGRINPSYRPIVWSATLSGDGTYVLSVTKKANSIYYGNEFNVVTAPSRRGYTFKGYSTTEGATVAEYSATDISNVSDGTTLYAVWEVASVVDPPVNPEGPTGEQTPSEEPAA